MKNNGSTLFYLKKPKNYATGMGPIYMRITVDGVRKDFSTGKNCDLELVPLRGDRFKNNKIKFVKTWQEYLKSHSRRWL
ncbi:Arm DNA-binding domain-containing protein [Pedobacter sp.]